MVVVAASAFLPQTYQGAAVPDTILRSPPFPTPLPTPFPLPIYSIPIKQSLVSILTVVDLNSPQVCDHEGVPSPGYVGCTILVKYLPPGEGSESLPPLQIETQMTKLVTKRCLERDVPVDHFGFYRGGTADGTVLLTQFAEGAVHYGEIKNYGSNSRKEFFKVAADLTETVLSFTRGLGFVHWDFHNENVLFAPGGSLGPNAAAAAAGGSRGSEKVEMKTVLIDLDMVLDYDDVFNLSGSSAAREKKLISGNFDQLDYNLWNNYIRRWMTLNGAGPDFLMSKCQHPPGEVVQDTVMFTWCPHVYNSASKLTTIRDVGGFPSPHPNHVGPEKEFAHWEDTPCAKNGGVGSGDDREDENCAKVLAFPEDKGSKSSRGLAAMLPVLSVCLSVCIFGLFARGAPLSSTMKIEEEGSFINILSSKLLQYIATMFLYASAEVAPAVVLPLVDPRWVG